MSKQLVLIDLAVAKLIRRVYLPTNINRARTAAPEVREAVKEFDRAIVDAERNQAKRKVRQ